MLLGQRCASLLLAEALTSRPRRLDLDALVCQAVAARRRGARAGDAPRRRPASARTGRRADVLDHTAAPSLAGRGDLSDRRAPRRLGEEVITAILGVLEEPRRSSSSSTSTAGSSGASPARRSWLRPDRRSRRRASSPSRRRRRTACRSARRSSSATSSICRRRRSAEPDAAADHVASSSAVAVACVSRPPASPVRSGRTNRRWSSPRRSAARR